MTVAFLSATSHMFAAVIDKFLLLLLILYSFSSVSTLPSRVTQAFILDESGPLAVLLSLL